MTASWQEALSNNVHHYRRLPAGERQRLEDASRIFAAEKYWEGAGGMEVTVEMRATISGMACLLLLGAPDYYFDQASTVIVYPRVMRRRAEHHQTAGIHHDTVLEGLAQQAGAVVLSWRDVLRDGRSPGYGNNLVIHEFAHKLDELEGFFDGMPPLRGEARQRWRTIADREFRRLGRSAQHGRPTLLDPYGAQSPAEFFAVSTECFFELPLELQDEIPDYYGLLAEYFHVDPASWDWSDLYEDVGDEGDGERPSAEDDRP